MINIVDPRCSQLYILSAFCLSSDIYFGCAYPSIALYLHGCYFSSSSRLSEIVLRGGSG